MKLTCKIKVIHDTEYWNTYTIKLYFYKEKSIFADYITEEYFKLDKEYSDYKREIERLSNTLADIEGYCLKQIKELIEDEVHNLEIKIKTINKRKVELDVWVNGLK